MFGKISAATGLAAVLMTIPATAQTARPSGPPPSWDSLIPCAQKADPAEGFECYQAAVRAAGYAPNPEIAAAAKRRTFGLALPSFHRAAKASPEREAGQAQAGPAAAAPSVEEPENQVAVVLEQVAVIPPLNRLLLVTKEGAIWQQTDSEIVAPLPRPGQSMTVIKGSVSGFFCQFDKRNKVRCVRTH